MTLLQYCRPGMTVVDVGAHIGLFTLPMANAVGPAGHIHAIEPDPINHAKLLRHLRMNPAITWVTVHNVAISHTRETLHLSSPLRHNRAPRVSDTGEQVEALALDDLGITPDLVKIDIEGYEARALAGATKTLADRPPMLVEVSEPLLQEAGSSAAQLLAALRALGYRVVDLETGQPAQTPIGHTDVVCTAE
jgi:FkbM family methyltransferase